jgi:type III pantothenate kinase
MILCLDAGNTRLKWGLRAGDAWLAGGAIEHGGLAVLAAQLPAPPYRVLACNVAGPAVAAEIEFLAGCLDAPLEWFRSSAAACGLINGYQHPGQLGADRWAALIGARQHHAGASVVVMAGTATTIDQLDGSGHFRGGLILPGLRLMRAALAQNTAGLPFAAGRYSNAPTSTDDAIVSGSLHATLGAIERMRAALGDATVLLSGGAAAELAPCVERPFRHIDNLVLEGLAAFAAA